MRLKDYLNRDSARWFATTGPMHALIGCYLYVDALLLGDDLILTVMGGLMWVTALALWDLEYTVPKWKVEDQCD